MKTDYERPVVVWLVYLAAGIVAAIALCLAFVAFLHDAGVGFVAPLLLAAGIFLIGYVLDLLARILHEATRIRVKLEGPVTVAPPAHEEVQYFLQINEKSTGPFPLKVLLNRLRMGTLLGAAQVQRIDGGNWVPLETLET
ncbi:MAG TPA: hypothetical protein VG733_09635 [Chthoniobacteraceae bacterium]|nr:hypothetical protein [Chthoniobacteraceae bacterium]